MSAMPSHCSYIVADIARGFAAEWLAFADDLERCRQGIA
jgi:hypothetical protein